MRLNRILVLSLVITISGCMQVEKRSAVNQSQRYTHADVAKVKQILKQESARAGIALPLALAVAHAESSFNPKAESVAGARGVMQIMPMTAEREYGIHRNRLWEPEINIRMGLHFLKRLLLRYHGNESLALSYYNGGSAVGSWPNARVIPATRGYVNKVLRLKRQYSRYA
ncbi:MAG: lytic transglycosylase domain-containing protein [Gammaproteobacteria bacterium]|jgi:soluble lytic murein transglycosylase-like protein|nr:lytic transglycosylase domain-containing protein [Gammaproteobacteria bacterium]MBT7306600.1 lytic transglycosylase domain-containing protein [Gammaproteobacteria bacterium]